MPDVIVKFRKCVPRPIRRKLKLKPGELEAAKKVYFPVHQDYDATYPDLEPEDGHDAVRWPLIASVEAEPDPNLPDAVIEFSHWVVTGATYIVRKDDGAEVKVVEGARGVYTEEREIAVGVGFDTNVVATAWYYPDDGSTKGLQIDAFHVDLDDYLDDDFVVTVDPHKELTQQANEIGIVPTDNKEKVDENVVAYPKIRDFPFLSWVPRFVPVKDTIYVNTDYPEIGNTGRALTAKYLSNGIAWAIYRLP